MKKDRKRSSCDLQDGDKKMMKRRIAYFLTILLLSGTVIKPAVYAAPPETSAPLAESAAELSAEAAITDAAPEMAEAAEEPAAEAVEEPAAEAVEEPAAEAAEEPAAEAMEEPAAEAVEDSAAEVPEDPEAEVPEEPAAEKTAGEEPADDEIILGDSSNVLEGSCGAEGSTVNYTLTGSESEGYILTVSGTGAMADYGESDERPDERPWESYIGQLAGIVIGEGITRVGSGAFYYDCYSDESVQYTEEGMPLLAGTSVILPETLHEIGEGAFSGQGIRSVDLKNVVQIEEGAFYGCCYLGTVSIPSSVEVIGGCSFSECTNLVSVDLPDCAVNLGYEVFYGDVSLKEVVIPQKIAAIGSGLLGRCTGLEKVTILCPLEVLPEYFVSGCDHLEEVILPETLKVIGSCAFLNCSALSKVELPEGLECIDESVFIECTALQSIGIPSSVSQLGSYVFARSGIRELAIPDAVTVLPRGLAEGCSALEKITVGSGVKEIPGQYFRGLAALKEAVLSEGLETIGSFAFFDTPIEKIVLPASVTSMGAEAFGTADGTGGPIDVVYGGNITALRALAEASSSCVRLLQGTVTCADPLVAEGTLEENTEISWRVTYEDGTFLLTVSGQGAIPDYWTPNDYKLAPWASYGEDIQKAVIEQGITGIGYYAFGKMNALEEAVLSDTVQEVGRAAFFSCAKLSTVHAGSGLLTIGSAAFDGSPVKNMTLPEGLESIGEAAFRGNALVNAVIPSSVTEIGSAAFASDTLASFTVAEENENFIAVDGALFTKDGKTLMQVPAAKNDGTWTVPAGTETILREAFLNSGIGGVILPDSVKTIEEYAFHDAAVSVIRLNEGLEQIDDNAFYGCLAEELVIPSTISYGGAGIFNGCGALRKVTLNTGNMTGNALFKDMELTEVRLSGSVESIAQEMFSGAVIGSLYISEGTVKIEENAFQKAKIENLYYPRSLSGEEKNIVWSAFGRTAANLGSVENVWFSGNRTEWNVLQKALSATINEVFYAADVHYADPAYGRGVIVDEEGNDLIAWTLTGETDKTLTFVLSPAEGRSDVAIPDDIWGASDIGAPDIGYQGKQGIVSVIIDEGITRVGAHAFSSMSNLSEVSLPEGLREIGDWAFSSASMSDLMIPETLRVIGEDAFAGCAYLSEISLPEGFEELGAWAFSGTSLETFVIPSTMGGFYTEMFDDMNALSEIRVREGNVFYSDIDGVLYDKEQKRLLRVPRLWSGELILPDTVTTIREAAGSNSGITSVSFPPGFAVIPRYAFSFCEDLRTISLPTSIERIEEYAFCNTFANAASSEENTLILRGGTQVILNSIYMGEGNEEILEKSTVVYTQVEPMAEGTMDDGLTWTVTGRDNGCQLIIGGEGAMAPFENGTAPWAAYRDEITYVIVESGVTSVAASAFAGLSKVQYADIYASLTALGENAFAGCAMLTDVCIDEGLFGEIENGAFAGCVSLKCIDLYECGKIGSGAFAGCTSLSRIYLDGGAPVIAEDAFSGCGVIDAYAFTGDDGTDPYGFTGEGYQLDYGAEDIVWHADSVITDYLVQFIEAQVILEDEIGMYFTVFVSDDVSDEDYVEVTFKGEKTRYSVSELKQDTASALEGVLYRLRVPVSAKDMTARVTLQAFVNGTAGSEMKYSLREYAMKILQDEYGRWEKYRALVKNMLNYGGYAQIYFGENTADLANEGIMEEGETDPVTLEYDHIFNNGADVMEYDPMQGIHPSSVTLLLKSRPTLRVYFTLDEGAVPEEYQVNVYSFGNSVVVEEKETTSELLFDEEKGKYYISIEELPISEALGTGFEVIVTRGEKSALFLRCYVGEYIDTAAGSEDQALADLAKSFYYFCKEAERLYATFLN